MFQVKEFAKLLFLLILAGEIADNRADVFPQCTNVEADTFVVAIDDCTSYIYCNGEDSFRDTCPDQTYFDGQAQECAFDDAGVCLQPLETTTMKAAITVAAEIENNSMEELPVEATTTSSASPSPSHTEVRPSKPEGSRPHCDTAGDGYHPHPDRCEYYYSCLRGYLTIVRCPYKFGWDYAEGRCKPMSEVHCFSL
ncbi:uncharacterized protein LOC117787085 [Drosophila innubila]|uniref:uncharacterized protein LOC117787085 n=1 Tax=Drosophila innubila TaxID=198719 RepID=UPI00148B7D2B|nr:uncharacterized protein LOC117787085 [Drosophila innubila]